MYELRIIYNDGTCAVWKNIAIIHIDANSIYFTISSEPDCMHFIDWKENYKEIKVVKK